MTSTIKVNNIQNQCGANIINENSNTITIGASGDTIALASGASQSGFGREGSVNWQTGSIKTTTFTAVSGEGYFVDTSSGGVTCNLPAGSAGAIVAFADYTRTFGTNALTVTPNGSEKIGGIAASMILQVNGEAATLVYVDGTEGWINVQQTETSNTGNPFIVATGGTTTTCGNDKIHTFTGPGTFTVSQVSSNCAAENIVSYLIVGGGGGGGAGCTQASSGAGAGGFRELKSPTTPYTASPLDGYPNAPNRVTVTAQSYSIVVGGGGTGGSHVPGGPGTAATQGADSSFGGITGAGGAKGAHGGTCYGYTGGSGSGGNQGPFTGTGDYYNGPGCAGAGNTPPVTPSQGNPGGTGYTIYNTPPGNSNMQAGGGGGATAAGGDATASSLPANTNTGGAGATTNITGSPVAYAGGGGGGTNRQGPLGPANPIGGAGGTGGGGNGGQCGDGGGSAAAAGGTNTGGGGGGTGNQPGASGGNGGSGIVVIRYKYK